MRQPNFQWCEDLGLRHPVVQAGMGGGCSGAELAAAVSRAGGLGTVGTMAPAEFRDALARTRRDCGDAPFACNLLMPFVREGHIRACLAEKPAVVVRFYGFGADLVTRLQQAGIRVWQQIGDLAQAQRALADGVDGLIAQGAQAGGHLATGSLRTDALLRALRNELPGCSVPILAAGGIHDQASAREAMTQGADGVVAGTRLLLTPEAGIHAAYKSTLLAAQQTVATWLFSFGWVAPHRVAVNAATQRWLDSRNDAPAWALRLNRWLEPARNLLPMTLAPRMVGMQRPGWPLYSPFPLTPDMQATAIDVTPVYAGECVRAINDVRPAADIVAELASGCAADSA